MGVQVHVERNAAEPAFASRHEFAALVDDTIDRARRTLLALQRDEGYWLAPLEANAEMNAEFIFFNRFMGEVDPALEAKLAKYLLDTQLPDGGWSVFHGGEGYLSYTVEAYFALKIAGISPEDLAMISARRWIVSKGGIAATGTLARFYLATLGQIPWSATAAIPVEITLLPHWFPGNPYDLASWARGTLFALTILQALRPTVEVAKTAGVSDLYSAPMHLTRFLQPQGDLLSLRSVLNVLDRILRLYDRHHLTKLRRRAMRHAEAWILEHQEANGSFGGIEPTYLLSTMALKALGYRNDHPVIRKALAASRELIWDFGDSALCMPCVSPNWDTALACKALLASGLPGDHPALAKSAQWFVDHQVFKRGDWAVKRPDIPAGGWPFEFFNNAYPDVDDTSVIVSLLPHIGAGDPAARDRATRAGAGWVTGMQWRNGGFAAFDADNDSEWLNRLPFADVEAVTDPACADLTGRALEMMAAVGYGADHPVAGRAIKWLAREQERDGSWLGRWGVNYIYGTYSALAGLRAIGVDRKDPMMRRAAAWLLSRQNPDGGWGESPLSDRDPALSGRGESTASQTAWAIMGLIAGEERVSAAVIRGVRWLAERQNEAGAWNEEAFTGGGFPNHFYMRYYLYPLYFPLMALGQFRQAVSGSH